MRTQLGALALGATILAACSGYGAPDSVVYGQDVVTLPKVGWDPSGITTFYFDTTATAVGSTPGSVVDTIDLTSGPYVQIYNAIKANMKAVGYTNEIDLAAVDPPRGVPAVGLHISVLKGSQSTYYPGYWCDYWYYYSCYYDWVYAGSYNYGMMVMELVDLQPTTGTAAPILWQAGVYGVSQGTAYDVPRAASGVNQAFAQSPYLAH